MEALMMSGKRFLLIFILAPLLFHCGAGDPSQSPPQILGTLDLTTLPAAAFDSHALVSPAQKDRTKILAVALGQNDEWLEAPVARDGKFAVACQRGQSYTLAFLAEDGQGPVHRVRAVRGDVPGFGLANLEMKRFTTETQRAQREEKRGRV